MAQMIEAVTTDILLPVCYCYGQRKFYFNMVLGRSYWEVPEHVAAQVQRPMVDEFRRWNPTTEGDAQSAGMHGDPDEIKRRREEAIAAVVAAGDSQVGGSDKGLSLQERMALAAQRKKEIEIKRAAEEPRASSKSAADTANSNEYLEMVRQLQHVDRETEASGGKWLVR